MPSETVAIVESEVVQSIFLFDASEGVIVATSAAVSLSKI